jgi:hypothetical protein
MSLKRQTLNAARRPLQRLGFDLTRRTFYSPIPHDLPDTIWGRRDPLRGIHFDLNEQLDWVTAQVAPYAGEFCPPISLPGYVFRYANASFGHGDADVLYGAIRSRKPPRIVELGSGNSSVVIRLALQRNLDEDASCDYQAYDPYPNDLLASGPMAMSIHPVAAQQLDEQTVTSLTAGDILFVDTTHTVRTGGGRRSNCPGLLVVWG